MPNFKRFLTVSVLLSLFLSNAVLASIASDSVKAMASDKFRTASIPFIQNKGQLHSDVAYYAKTFAGTVFITHKGEIVYSLPIEKDNKNSAWVLKESIVSQQVISALGGEAANTDLHFFRGKKPESQQNISSVKSVELKKAYPGIDVQINATSNNIEKLFIVKPNANPKQIRLLIDGGNKLYVNDAKQLVISTDAGDVAFTKPIAYQELKGKKIPVEIAYSTKGNEYGFTLGQYDTSKTLIIDPLIASTFLGGDNTNAISDFEFVGDIVEKDGFVYVAGVTDSSNFPTTTGFNSFAGGVYDGYIAKFDSNLSTLVSSTFLGGSSYDEISGIALDDAGNVYVAGRSGGGDFPFVEGGYQFYPTIPAGTFIAKLSNDLSTLMATSFVAGNSLSGKLTIGNNSVYLIGRINSPNVPTTPDALDTTCGGDGACDPSGSFGITSYYGYAIRQDLNLTSILAATYLGKNSDHGIQVGSNSNVYMISTGGSVSPTKIIAVDTNLTTIVSQLDYGSGTNFRAFDLNDNFIVAIGTTNSNDLPVSQNAFDSLCGPIGFCGPTNTGFTGSDNYITKVSLDLQTTIALTYFGGTDIDLLNAIKIDSDGNIAIGGSTDSADIPTSNNAFDKTLNSGRDAYIAKFNGDLSSLLYGSYIGGSESATGEEITTGADGKVYISGHTGSTNFPVTSGAFDTTYNGGDNDLFVSLFDTSGGGGDNQPPVADAGEDQSVSTRSSVYLDGSGSFDPDGDALSYSWRQISGKSVSLKNANSVEASFRAPRVKRRTTAVLVFELTVSDDQGASSSSRVSVSVSR